MSKFLPFALLSLLLAGCESMPSMKERVRDRFAAVVPKVSVYEGDSRTVYLAAQAAFKRLDYTVTRASVGGLRIEAASRINTSVAFRDSRQLIAVVKIGEVGPNQSEVTLQLREQLEGEGLGGASELALREHGFYETYFAVLQQVLAEEAAVGAAKKN
ncbi:MAG: hypothetical protein Q8J74_11915 [Candidatus Didemnitutus sp.]|nr:hypothetical protein [Candidatus Didemnitutus sp.]